MNYSSSAQNPSASPSLLPEEENSLDVFENQSIFLFFAWTVLCLSMTIEQEQTVVSQRMTVPRDRGYLLSERTEGWEVSVYMNWRTAGILRELRKTLQRLDQTRNTKQFCIKPFQTGALAGCIALMRAPGIHQVQNHNLKSSVSQSLIKNTRAL